MALPEPVDVMDDGGLAGLDAAMIGVDGLVPADGRIFEIVDFLFGGEERDVGLERALVPFQGKHVIGLFGGDLAGDGALA